MSISIVKMINKIKNTYVVFDKDTKKILYSNQKARDFIGDIDGNIDLDVVFDSTSILDDYLKNADPEVSVGEIPDINITLAKLNEKKLVSVFIGYFNEDKTQVFIEIEPKSDIKKMFEAMQELTIDILFLINIEKHMLFFRGELSKKIGLPDSITNFPNSLIELGAIHPEDVDVYLVSAEDMMDGIARSCEIRIKMENNEFNWYSLSSVIVHDDYNRPIKVLGKLKNIQKDKDLEFKMSHDILTKTLNKISFINCATEVLHSSDDKEEVHALFFIDIDNFRAIDEHYTNNFSDEFLKSISKNLTASIRETDLIGRIGIDSFAIFLPNIDCDVAIAKKAELILNKVSQEFSIMSSSFKPKVSVGVSKYPMHGKTYNELQKKADVALFNCKGQGKNTAVIYDNTDNIDN